MIHWHVGEVNFYKVYKRRKVEELVQERLQREVGGNLSAQTLPGNIVQ